ncbi:MAG: single-stranded DNA-binding protein [Clostridia bacterium]|nr:single-stranded DNA-binding protein [Clostridia bacterium]
MVNIAVLEGRLTAAPELKHTPSYIPMTRFSIAVARNYSKGGERQTDFFDIVAWRNTAEFICKYFKKGNLIMVEGQIQTDLFEGRDGIKRKNFYIVANNVNFVGTKADNMALNTESEKNNDIDNVNTRDEKTNSGYSNSTSFEQEDSAETAVDDDDLPF